jgi:hypothetical protein
LAGKVTGSPPEPGDAEALNDNLRDADRAEIIASHGPDTLRTIRQAIALSTHCVAVRLDGALVSIFGVVPFSLVGGHGSPWMLGTPLLDEHPRPLARAAHRYFGLVAQVYPVLENHVDARHTASIKLLKWLGCSFDEPRPYGAAGLPFLRFEKRSR